MMRLVMGCCVMFLMVPLVGAADMTVIYRDSDKLVTSYTPDPGNVATEIGNAVNSPSLGGVASDYATVTVSEAVFKANRDKILMVNAGNQVVFIPDPVRVQREADRAGGKAFLLGLGMPQAQIDALLGD